MPLRRPTLKPLLVQACWLYFFSETGNQISEYRPTYSIHKSCCTRLFSSVLSHPYCWTCWNLEKFPGNCLIWSGAFEGAWYWRSAVCESNVALHLPSFLTLQLRQYNNHLCTIIVDIVLSSIGKKNHMSPVFPLKHPFSVNIVCGVKIFHISLHIPKITWNNKWSIYSPLLPL